MRRVSQQPVLGCVALLLALTPVRAHAAGSILTLPANSSIEMVVTRPVWAATAKVGDPLYLQTSSAVTVGASVAIPEGSYVLAQLKKITKPTNKLSQAVLLVDFQKIIFANGYTVVLDANGGQTTSVVTVQVTAANDLLLDNGTRLTTTLGSAVALKQKQVVKAIALAKPPDYNALVSATRCVPDPGSPGTPGTAGTPDTVIPGTPGTPPSSTINADGSVSYDPGTPGTPDTVIPGTPGSPGDPGTPATVCPDPPKVTSSVLVSLADALPQQ